MRRGELGRTTHHTNGYPWGLDGMVVMLKVMGLLAGYAIFVWISMAQMERRYLTPSPETAAVDRESLGQPVAVPGAVVIQGRSPMMAGEPLGRSRVPPPQPGRVETF